MFQGLSAEDWRYLLQGMIIFLVAVIAGTAAAEKQLNALQCREQVKVFNVQRSGRGEYSLYLLGEYGELAGAFSVGTLELREAEIVFGCGDQSLRLPTRIAVSLRDWPKYLEGVTGYWLDGLKAFSNFFSG